MAKGTIIFFFILTTIASLLLGINIGKKLGVSQLPTANYQPPTITITPSPTITITPTIIASPSAMIKKSTGISTFTDASCGFSFSYPGSFLKQNTTNGQSTILADPDDPTALIAATCAKSIPKPPVSSDKIESIMLDKVPATLYHDKKTDGSPRDEVIVRHPANGLEIILAGYGDYFQQVLASFKFVQ